MNDEDAYERSADLRLLDLSRRSLGVSQTASPWRHAGTSRVDLLAEDEAPARPAGPLLLVHFVARPPSGLIAGARLTLAVAIQNEGADDAVGVVLRIGYGKGIRPLETDAKRDDDALDADAVTALFENGLTMGTIRGGERRTVVATAIIEPGIGPVLVEADVRAASAPIIAASPIALERAVPAGQPAAARPLPAPTSVTTAPVVIPDAAPIAPPLESTESPFYELEPEEAMVFEAADAAISSAARVPPLASVVEVATPTPIVKPIPPVEAPTPALPAALVAPAPVAPAPVAPGLVAPALVAPAPVVSPVAVEPAVRTASPIAPTAPVAAQAPSPERPLVLARTIDRARLDAIGGMFASSGVGMLAHFLLANLIAAGRSPDESDPFGLATFIEEQTTVLNRLWVAKRLRKSMDVAEMPARIEPLAPLSRERIASAGSLVASIAGPERDFVNSAIARGSLTFLRARQIALILQPTAVSDGERAVPVPALVEYAKRAQNLMTKYALRAATKTPDEALATVDPVLDGYAKDVLAYLETIAR
jgi:hypothetical protein